MADKTQAWIAWPKRLLFVAGLFPLGRLLWFAYSGQLGANPIEFITRSTGTWTLVFLLLSLSITPLRQLLRQPQLIKFRRMIGLYAFFYACLHLTTYFWLDQFFDWPGIVKDIIKRPFITVGMASFLLMAPLALTSTNAMIRRLGGRNWQRLHRLVYAVGVGGVVHYWWLVKKDLTEPLIYGSVLTVLLGYRLVVLWRKRRAASGGSMFTAKLRPHS